MKNVLEQMLESLVNDDQAKAEELFHEYVVAKSREIYENLIESELSDEDEDQDDDESTEEGFNFEADDDDDKELDLDDEDGDEGEDGDEPDLDGVMGGDPTDDLASEIDADIDSEGDREPEELFQDLESIVDELQAKFDAMDGGEEAGDDLGDLEGELDGEEPEGDLGDLDGEEDDEIKDSFDDDELQTFREYVEKVNPKMGDNGANTKSTVAGKNDMGGTAANIAAGGEAKGEGTKGGLANPSPKEDNAGNVNVPGGKTGVKHLKKQPGHGAEKKATGDNGDKSAQSLFRGRK